MPSKACKFSRFQKLNDCSPAPNPTPVMAAWVVGRFSWTESQRQLHDANPNFAIG